MRKPDLHLALRGLCVRRCGETFEIPFEDADGLERALRTFRRHGFAVERHDALRRLTVVLPQTRSCRVLLTEVGR